MTAEHLQLAVRTYLARDAPFSVVCGGASGGGTKVLGGGMTVARAGVGATAIAHTISWQVACESGER